MNNSQLLTITSLIVGGLGGLGVWIIVGSLASLRRPTLATRVAPWVSGLSREAHEVATASLARRNSASRNIAHRISERVGRRLPTSLIGWLDGGAQTRVLLAQSGSADDVSSWRVKIIEAGIIGVVSGVGLGVVGLLTLHSSPVALAAFALIGLVAGVWLRRWVLRRSARTRVALMLEELPALCELLAICLSAGEGFREAVARVSARGEGPLVAQFRAVLRATELGTPIVTALSTMSLRLDVLPLSRTIDHIVSSIEGGTPLAAVLRTQAAEARGEAGRRLQERASAREVIMLLPLVFLILPITIAFAVFPGLLVIQAGF